MSYAFIYTATKGCDYNFFALPPSNWGANIDDLKIKIRHIMESSNGEVLSHVFVRQSGFVLWGIAGRNDSLLMPDEYQKDEQSRPLRSFVGFVSDERIDRISNLPNNISFFRDLLLNNVSPVWNRSTWNSKVIELEETDFTSCIVASGSLIGSLNTDENQVRVFGGVYQEEQLVSSCLALSKNISLVTNLNNDTRACIMDHSFMNVSITSSSQDSYTLQAPRTKDNLVEKIKPIRHDVEDNVNLRAISINKLPLSPAPSNRDTILSLLRKPLVLLIIIFMGSLFVLGLKKCSNTALNETKTFEPPVYTEPVVEQHNSQPIEHQPIEKHIIEYDLDGQAPKTQL